MKIRNVIASIGLVLGILLFLISNVNAAQNPAAVYCKEMGYKYSLENTVKGQVGYCTLPDKTKCDEWKFFKGECGKKYSYCSKKEYLFQLKINNSDPLLKDVPSCLIPDDKLSKFIGKFKIKQGYRESSIIEVMNLTTKIKGKVDNKIQAITINNSSKSSKNVKSLSLPSSFDWRNYNGSNWMTPVRNQGTCGSCYIFATMGAIESKYKIGLNNFSFNPDLAEQHFLSCNSAYLDPCSGGSYNDVYNFVKSVGVLEESDYPYVATNTTCNLIANWQNKVHKVINYSSISCFSSGELKQALIINGPLSASIPSWAHAVVIVGWDSSDNFIFKNSWGLDYGTNGYGSISFDQLGYYFEGAGETDWDRDNIGDTRDICPTISDNFCNGCPSPNCNPNLFVNCPVANKPFCDYESDVPIQPFAGLNITKDIIFKSGTYSLPRGLEVKTNNVRVTCNNTLLKGNWTWFGNPQGTTGVTIEGNNITFNNCAISNYDTGMQILGINNTILNNIIKSNIWAIQMLDNPSKILSNVIDTNIYGIEVLDRTPSSKEVYEIHNNNITNMTHYSLWSSSAAFPIINATYNWWGTNNAAIINDSIYIDASFANSKANVTWKPFITYLQISFTRGTPINKTVINGPSFYENVTWFGTNYARLTFWVKKTTGESIGSDIATTGSNYGRYENINFFGEGTYNYWVVICDDSGNCNSTETRMVSYKTIKTQNTNMGVGWNTINFTILPENKSLFNVLSSINGNYSQVKTQYVDGTIEMWDESLPDFANDLTEINYNQTYLINMKQNATITIEGYS